jgi:hypothetical protein
MSRNSGKSLMESIKHMDGCQGFIDRLKYHHISASVLCNRSTEEEHGGLCLGAQNKLGDTITSARGETGKWVLCEINIGQINTHFAGHISLDFQHQILDGSSMSSRRMAPS